MSDNAVLVVEDEPILQVFLRDFLSAHGFECTCASCCREARQAVAEREFACGLVDLTLPDGNGLELLPEFKRDAPWLVPIILTGDGSPETIIDTMRAGAFDYLTKPVESASLRSAVVRAVEHHQAIREQETLMLVLSEERQQLTGKLERATADIRRYAAQVKMANERLEALLRLTRLGRGFYTDEALFTDVLKELGKYLPIQCVALDSRDEFLTGFRDGRDGAVSVIVTETPGNGDDLAEDAETVEAAIRAKVERYAGYLTDGLAVYAYPQVFWGVRSCVVALLLPRDVAVDTSCDEFMSMCAHFVAFEWQEARLYMQVTQQASLGNIAVELTRGIIQGLTAIRTAADFVNETDVSAEAAEGLQIVNQNADKLRRQTQEFRQLASIRRDSLETVDLGESIDQVLDLISEAMAGRGILLRKEYQADCECVLSNSPTFARTLLDLISDVVRSAERGSHLVLSLSKEPSSKSILFQMRFREEPAEPHAHPLSRNQVKFLLARRAIQSCGGTLTLEHGEDNWHAFRITLPQGLGRSKLIVEAAQS